MSAFAPPVLPQEPPLPPAADPAVLDPGSPGADLLAAPPAAPALPPDVAAPPPPAADPFAVEAIVAAVGIEKFITHTLRKVYMMHLDRAAKAGDEIDRKLYQFIGSDAPEEVADLPPFDFETVRDALVPLPPPGSTMDSVLAEQAADIIGAFGDEAEAGYAAVQVVTRIQTYLVGKVPRRVHQSLAGPVQEMPAHSDVARFRRTWSIACDPLTVILDALNEYALSRGMVDAFQAMFPMLWQRVNQGVDSQLARKKATAPNFRLSVRKEQLLRILVKREDVTSKSLGVALQGMFKKAAAEAAPKPPKAKRADSAALESSAADRIGSGR